VPTTFKAIATVTVGSGGASTIEFNSIPQTYNDLCILLSVRDDRNLVTNGALISFNSSTSNFTGRAIYTQDTLALIPQQMPQQGHLATV
jgi:hypothetical protein